MSSHFYGGVTFAIEKAVIVCYNKIINIERTDTYEK